jgi:hypothetical protein
MDKLEKLCIKWLNENFNPMEPFIMKEYPDYIFHMKDGRCILQHNKKSGYVYVNYREIWKFFEDYFSMSNQQIKDITKIWVEEHYKTDITITDFRNCIVSLKAEEHYKMGNVSTVFAAARDVTEVEEHYKMGNVSTEKCIITDGELLSEKRYKEITTTKDQNEFYFNRDVEELYNQHTNG